MASCSLPLGLFGSLSFDDVLLSTHQPPAAAAEEDGEFNEWDKRHGESSSSGKDGQEEWPSDGLNDVRTNDHPGGHDVSLSGFTIF